MDFCNILAGAGSVEFLRGFVSGAILGFIGYYFFRKDDMKQLRLDLKEARKAYKLMVAQNDQNAKDSRKDYELMLSEKDKIIAQKDKQIQDLVNGIGSQVFLKLNELQANFSKTTRH